MAGEQQQLLPDTLINERYRITQLIGQGGMGAVYEARDQRLNGTVALKQTTITGEQPARAFEREAQLLARLRHPMLPKVIDYFTDEVGQFLVMEYFPGNDLGRLLAQRGGPFPVAQALDWADQLLGVLTYLHTQDPPVIHRDIKPQNMKLTDSGEIVLLDFGLAKNKPLLESRATQSGSIVGYTPMYAPLEQIQGTGTDPRSDLYSLAATLHHMLTFSPPVDTLSRAAAMVSRKPDPQPPAHTINPAVPEPVSLLLLRALALSPEERPATASQMRELLRQARDGTLPTKEAAAPTLLDLPDAQAWEQETQAGPTDAAAAAAATQAFAPTHAAGTQPSEATQVGEPRHVEASGQPAAAAPPPHPEPHTAHSGQAHRHAEKGYRSLFWPILLIGIGAIWLLRNVGVVPGIDFSVLWQLWPIWLILLGLDLIVGRRSPRISALMGSGAAVLILGLLLAAPVLGLNNGREPLDSRSSSRTVALDNTEEAEIELNLAVAETTIGAVRDQENLLEAEIDHYGRLDLDVEGNRGGVEREVDLSVDGPRFDLFDFDVSSGESLPDWEIGLSPAVPIDLTVQGGTGSTLLDLSAINLRGLELRADEGPGDWEILLPASEFIYDVLIEADVGDFTVDIAEDTDIGELEISGGVGEFFITIGDNASLDAFIDAGVGDVIIDLPDDAAVSIDVKTGIGEVIVPDDIPLVDGEANEGIWKTPGFEEAERQIYIVYNGGIGALIVE